MSIFSNAFDSHFNLEMMNKRTTAKRYVHQYISRVMRKSIYLSVTKLHLPEVTGREVSTVNWLSC